MKDDAKKTIRSLKEINNFPFYTATYYGNYRIDEYMQGAVDSPDAVIPFFEDLLKNIGAPFKLSFHRPPSGQPGCSAFYCKTVAGDAVVGKNLDWMQAPVLLLRTRPVGGLESLSMVNLNFCDFFNTGSFKYKLLLSPYVPLDGINKSGLVVSMLSVEKGAEYPVKPGRIMVGDFNIIRIILDSCNDVGEAVDVFKKYNLMMTGMLSLHYLIADKNRSCIVEFTNGEMNIEENKQVNYLTNFIKLKNDSLETEKRNCDRYCKIEKTLIENNNHLNTRQAATLLKEVSVFQPEYKIPSTIWSIVYDINSLNMKIRTGCEPKQYSVKLS